MIFLRVAFLICLCCSSWIEGANTYLKAHELKVDSGHISLITLTSQSPSYGFFMNSPDAHYLNSFPSLGLHNYNDLTQAGDTAILYSSGSINGTTTGLVIAPWSSSPVGIRIIPSGNVGFNTATPKSLLSVNGTTYTHQNIQVNRNLVVSGNIQFGGNINPVSSIVAFAGSTIPSGWLLCDGSAVSRTTYSALYALISTTYGPGNGDTTFNLPNLTGRRPIGLDSSDATMDGMGETSGQKTVSGTDLPSHDHTIASHTHTYSDTYWVESRGSYDSAELGRDHKGSGDSDTDNENHEVARTTASNGPGNTNTDTSGVTNASMTIMNPSITMKYMIKY